MDILWRGSWATRLRIGSGLVLFVFVLLHFLNVGLGLFSPDWMQRAQDWRHVVTRSLPGTAILYSALLIHAGLALVRVAALRTLKLPLWSLLQAGLGLSIPLLLIVHVVHTRLAHEVFAVNDRMSYLITLIWDTPSAVNQSLLLLIVWTHGCTGMHFWLRLKPWWRRALPAMIGVAALVPAFALAGFLTEGRRMHRLFADATARASMQAEFRWPNASTFAELARLNDLFNLVFWGLLGLVALVAAVRWLLGRRGKSVRIRYVDGPEVTSVHGPTLLEISQSNRVPHMALCGGRGRCTTCRVIVEDGADLLHPPSEAEKRSLKAVNAPPGARLACQMRPVGQTTVFRVFRPEGGRRRAGARQGQERRLAVLFLDMRGFTARTAGQLPYDVVFLLNRFFDAIVPPIIQAGGSVDKYLGDGLLAVFETRDEESSARAALQAAAGIGVALTRFNETQESEGGKAVRIGVGLHLGNLVLGEIGATGNAPRTIIGDTVNVASRLEAKTKEIGTQTLISGAVLHAAGIEIADLDLLTLDLRGVDAPVDALSAATWADLDDILAMLDKPGAATATTP